MLAKLREAAAVYAAGRFMVFLDEACVHQVDMDILRSRVVVLQEVFLDKVCIHQVDAAQGLSRSRKQFVDKVVDVLMQLKFQQSKGSGASN